MSFIRQLTTLLLSHNHIRSLHKNLIIVPINSFCNHIFCQVNYGLTTVIVTIVLFDSFVLSDNCTLTLLLIRGRLGVLSTFAEDWNTNTFLFLTEKQKLILLLLNLFFSPSMQEMECCPPRDR